MWPFISKEAKKMVRDVLSNGSIKVVTEQHYCPSGLYIKTRLKFQYDGYELMIGTDSFGHTTGSRYFLLFSSRDRKWIWKKLLESQSMYY